MIRSSAIRRRPQLTWRRDGAREREGERERENEERYLKDFLEHFHSTMFPELSYHKLS